MEKYTFGLLGELVINCGGAPLPLRAGKLRVLLASLLLDAGRTVSESSLIDHLWDEPPARARSTLQVYVVRLRQALAPHGPTISRSSSGYRIEVSADQVDLYRFRSLVASECLDLRTQLGHLREALGLWRGQALADVPSEALRPEAARLGEERLSVLERRIEIEIELGGHRELVPELRVLTDRHPTRERFAALLMIALHHAGRSADALEVYRGVYRRFADELGIRPGKELADLQDRILRCCDRDAVPTAEGSAGCSCRSSFSPFSLAHQIRPDANSFGAA